MWLTVSRKTAKNLAVRRKKERILTVSRKKMSTVKRSNHKIRSRILLLSLMRLCVLVARITIETGSVESVCVICRMDVVARVDRRFDSSSILRISILFHADWLRWLY